MLSKSLLVAVSAALTTAASPALAGTAAAYYSVNIPEVGATGAVSAIVVVGAVAAAFWERKRRK